MAEKLMEKCIYCGGEILYTGLESLVKCGFCGRTFAVMKFQSEQVKMRQALEEGKAAQAALEEAKQEQAQAQERLNTAVTALSSLDASQKNAEKKLNELFKQTQADQQTREAIAGLLEGLKSGQEQGQDTLGRLMRALADSREEGMDKLTLLQETANKLLSTQNDLVAKSMAQVEILQMLQGMQLKSEEKLKLQNDFVMWNQSAHAEDTERLQKIQGSTSALLEGQKALNDKVDALRQAAEATQASVDAFHGEYQADKAMELANLYHQADNFQRDRVFDNAAQTYRKMLVKGCTDTEIYWRLVMCHYCVEYQRDDDDNLIPTILNPDLTAPEEISERRDLQENIGEYGDFYLGELRKIDEILDRYRELRHQVQYDVFISVKQSVDGHQTQDSDKASDLYDHLMSLGLRVFNSRRTPIPAGQEFEPYIISALMSAKVLIVLGTSPKYINAQWVRNEWSRFQWLQRREKKNGGTERRLICYLCGSMQPSDLKAVKGLNPNEQAIVESATAIDKLDASLAYLMPKPDPKPGPAPEPTPQPTSVNLDTVLRQMTNWLYRGRFDKVISRYDELTDEGLFQDQARLHLRVLCAEKHVEEIDQLPKLAEKISNHNLFRLARRMCRSEEDQKLLDRLQKENEENLKSKIEKPEPEKPKPAKPKPAKPEPAKSEPMPDEELPKEEYLKALLAGLQRGDYDWVLRMYDKYVGQTPYHSSPRFHIYALCAERGVSDFNMLANSDKVLTDEPKFQTARRVCTSGFEMSQLSALARENEDYRSKLSPGQGKDVSIVDILRKMNQLLAVGSFKQILDLYQQYYLKAPFKNSVRLHLLALCAERGVKSINMLPQSMAVLADEPKYRAARLICRDNDDLALLTRLRGENEDYRRNNKQSQSGPPKPEAPTELLTPGECLTQMKHALSNGDFAEAQTLYDRYRLKPIFKDSPRLHLYALCAQRQVRSIDLLATSSQSLIDEPNFRAARMVARSGTDKDLLANLLKANEEYRSKKNQPAPPPKPETPTTPLTPGECLIKMKQALSDNDFAAVQALYDQYGTTSPFKDSPRLHLYALCAQRQVRSVDLLATSTQSLIDEPCFRAARMVARSGTDKDMLANLLKANQEYIGKNPFRKPQSGNEDADTLFQRGVNCELGKNGLSQSDSEALRWYRKAADMGHTAAQYNVGVFYHFGRGTTQNYAEALKWYRKAAEHGYADAQNNLGVMYNTGLGVSQNPAEAFRWYRLAAEQGLAISQNNIGNMYENGKGTAKDLDEAAKWYRKAAEQGYAKAQCNLGNMYETGRGVSKNLSEALKWYRKSADQGFASAQFSLGVMYHDGLGVAQNHAEAMRWYQMAAGQGYAAAECNIGVLYQHGLGVAKDLSEALKWYRKAAGQGNARAQHCLGAMYHDGTGVAQNYAEAMQWYQKAAAQGYSDSECNIGVLYQYGLGVAKNMDEAVNWYRKAADRGQARAQCCLGAMYHNGLGVKKNYAEAMRWYQKAAEQGHSAAQYDIGLLYESGLGVAKDVAVALEWYRKAAAKGDEDAKKRLKALEDAEAKAKQEELKQAQEQAADVFNLFFQQKQNNASANPPTAQQLTDFWRQNLPSIHNTAAVGPAITPKLIKIVSKIVPPSSDEAILGVIHAKMGMGQGAVTLMATDKRIYINIGEKMYPTIVAEYAQIASASTSPMHTNPKKRVLTILLKNRNTLTVANPSNAFKDTINFECLANTLNALVKQYYQ